MLSLSQIQCFVMTVDHGSVTAAARALGVSPQAVSKSVNDLERTLDRPLFVRRASGLKPTPYGLTFCRKARRMLREARELEDFSKGMTVANRQQLLLLLCVPKTANLSSISQRIGSFLNAHLGIPSVVERGSLDQCLDKLAFNEADAFITIGRTAIADMDVNVIDSVDVGALLVDGHPLAAKDALTLDDVRDHPLYLTPDFAFFDETVLDQLRHSPKAAELQLRQLAMSIHGLYSALVRQRGGIIMPTIKGIDDWMPGTTTVPFDVREVHRVPLCLVTPREGKTEYGIALENLLVHGPGERLPVSQAVQSAPTSERH